MMSLQPLIKPIAFASIVLAALFVVILGSKLILSHCAQDGEGQCITVDRTAKIAAEVAQLNEKLELARKNASEMCSEPEISSKDWNSGNAQVLEGCWELQQEYAMYYEKYNKKNNLQKWTFCLDEAGGNAVQNLYFEDGLSCLDEKLYYEFVFDNDLTRLRLSDGIDLPCSGGRYNFATLYKRDILCELDDSGAYASCYSQKRAKTLEPDIVLRRQLTR